jgi:LysR family transcriptional activator of nhaA
VLPPPNNALEAHAIDVVLSNSAVRRDARAPFRHHLLNQQPVSLVGRPRPDWGPFRFPEALRTEPILLPSLDSDIRVGFDRLRSARMARDFRTARARPSLSS